MSEFRVIVARVEIDRWEAQEREMVAGSTIDVCRACQGSVWLSPQGHRFAYEEHPDDSEIICVECHIQLEIERRKEDKNAKPVPVMPVPGAGPLPEPVRRAWNRATEKEIKEGLEDG
jgi:hypothetical protein